MKKSALFVAVASCLGLFVLPEGAIKTRAQENTEPVYSEIDCSENYTDYGIVVASLNRTESIASVTDDSEIAECLVLLQARSATNFNEYDSNVVVQGPDFNYTLKYDYADKAAKAVQALQSNENIIYAE